MKTWFAIVTMLLIAGTLVAQSKPEQKPDSKTVTVTGKWTMTLEMSMGTATPTLEITKQEGEKIAGSYSGRYGTFPFDGSVKNRVIQFAFNMVAEDQNVTMSFMGEVSADGQSITKGTAVLGELGDATWSAKKEKN